MRMSSSFFLTWFGSDVSGLSDKRLPSLSDSNLLVVGLTATVSACPLPSLPNGLVGAIAVFEHSDVPLVSGVDFSGRRWWKPRSCVKFGAGISIEVCI